MAEIVAGVAMSHSPMIMTNEAGGGEKGQRFLNTVAEMKQWLKDMGTDVIVLISDDHFNSYFYDYMPSFTIGVDRCEGWGDWEIPEYQMPVEKELAKHVLDTGLGNNVDFAFSMRMKVDHGHTQAVHFLNDDLNIPVVPIAVNTAAPPLPTMDRCFQVGEVVRKAIETWESDKKVAIVASGGISHWVPIPKIDSEKPEDQELIKVLTNGRQQIEELDEYLNTRKTRVTSLKSGPVNEEWDRKFLRNIREKDYQALRQWSPDYIEENGGNGGQEIHNWLVLLGILQEFEPEVACYEPIPEWVTGMGVVKFHKV
ncbi:DODA-type extradiol aromatic ring-opening family dioxygenase [Cytobacillus kochii]